MSFPAGSWGSCAQLRLPADHVLSSGAVTFPGGFDQQGCPLVVFPVEEQSRLTSDLIKEEVVDFIRYFLHLHNKRQEKEGLLSVVLDLRQATLTTARFIAESLRLLEECKRTIHTVYVIQSKKKDVQKLLLKVLGAIPSKTRVSPVKCVLVKEVFELSNYIDPSQLTAALGGYLVYCHTSWVQFIKEIDAFVTEFLSVVHRLPSCIASIQKFSQQAVPTGLEDLKVFCSTNETRFQALRSELGLDELLQHCEQIIVKLRFPENDPCYQAMAGTTQFTCTAFEMLENYNRITAAVEKVELLWQQVLSKPRFQLLSLQHRSEAQQIMEEMKKAMEKLQSRRTEVAKEASEAEIFKSKFETNTYRPTMVLIQKAENLLLQEGPVLEGWAEDLHIMKEELRASVELPRQTLRAVSDFYYYFNTVTECMILRKLLTSPGALPLNDLQLALQWQFEFLMRTKPEAYRNHCDDARAEGNSRPNKWHKAKQLHGQTFPNFFLQSTVLGKLAASGKPPSLSSFDSGFDGAGSCHLDSGTVREGWGMPCRPQCASELPRSVAREAQIREENISSVSDSDQCREDSNFAMSGCSSKASIQIVPKISTDSLNFEVKVQRSATLPKNPWLSLPVEDLENAYTVTITPKRPVQTKQNNSLESTDTVQQSEKCGILQGQGIFEISSDLSPICNVLSSTINDVQDKPNLTAESAQTLLWDTYDFHSTEPDGHCESVIDPSVSEFTLCDWDLLEQESLQEVEHMLDRTAGILEQYFAFSDANLICNAINSMLILCCPFQGPMSSSELVEAGVLGIEDCPADEIPEHIPPGSLITKCKNTELAHAGAAKHLVGNRVISKSCSGPSFLEELKELHIIEDQIFEENLKIHELRCSEEAEQCIERQCSKGGSCGLSMERETFLLALDKEKREVERMEKSLHQERAQRSELKNRLGRGPRTACSNLKVKSDRNVEPSAPCDPVLQNQTEAELCQEKKLKSVPQNEAAGMHSSVLVESTTTLRCSNQDSTNKPGKSAELPEGLSCIVDSENSVKKCGAELEHNGPPCEETPLQQMETDLGSESPNRTVLGCLEDVPCTQSCTLKGSLEYTQDYLNEVVCNAIKDCTRGNESCHESDAGCENMVYFSVGRSENPVPAVRKISPSCSVSLAPAENSVRGAFDPGGCPNKPPVPKPRKASRPLKTVGQFSKGLQQKPCNTSLISSKDDHEELVSPVVLESQSTKEIPKPRERKKIKSEKPTDEEIPSSNLPVESDALSSGACCTKTSELGPSIVQEVSYFKTPIVLDTGSGLMKAGFADHDLPTTIFPTVLGWPKYEEVLNGNYERETYVGHEAQHMRGVLTLKYPMQNGIIRNWDEIEKIWHHTFQHQLHVDPEEHPVLLSEAAMNPRENRQRMVEIMFEVFNVPYTYVAMQAVLALYATGRTTGVVFDSGNGVSHSVPVFEGYSLPHAVQRFTLAGRDVTLHLKKLLQEKGFSFNTTAELEIVREIKEKCCCVAPDYDAELDGQEGPASSEMFYTLPDGQIINVGTERFRAPEILFKPELIGRDHYGMHESIFRSILRCDIDLRRNFVGNIVLSGGNTLLSGLPQRLQTEIRAMVPGELWGGVRVMSPRDRDFAVWSGGAVLASLPSFSTAWISQAEYEEFGPDIVFRKCF
ncbi:ACT protein, partial [Amia calva]|nr:ACT protein [Amia calva]